MKQSKSIIHTILTLLLALILAGCTISSQQPAPTMLPSPTPEPVVASPVPSTPHKPTTLPVLPANLPTATAFATPKPQAGQYRNPELGVSVDYPARWEGLPGEDQSVLVWMMPESREIITVLFYSPLPVNMTLEEAADQIRTSTTSGVTDVESITEHRARLDNGGEAWVSEYSGVVSDGSSTQAIVTSAIHGKRIFTILAYGSPEAIKLNRAQLNRQSLSLAVSSPTRYGIPEDQALLLSGGESSNPRSYDPATGGGDDLVFSGLVSFDPQLRVTPDLAESWDVSPDGTVYTFHLRPNARFHNRRQVTAQDVIYSWDRAADPKAESDTVLTYLGDIAGIRERHSGKADHISGLRAIDDTTLEVTIDAPKPYFVMKLTYRTAFIVDRANVESGPEWYRTPNGTGPYRLIRWEPGKVILYERNADFYLTPPAIPYIIDQLYAGYGLSLYETGDIDVTGIGGYNLERARDPKGPWPGQLVEGVNMCTTYMVFDVTQPPFDDPKVRQAFSLAIDRERYLEITALGDGLIAQGLFPPGLPGYNVELKGQTFDPERARQLLAESRYGGPAGLPPIVLTNSGFGSAIDADLATLNAMWQQNLGVSVAIENLEPNHWSDMVHAGRHGQLFSYGWCADYPDPENFADALFYTGAQENMGNYTNPELDQLLERARIEPDTTERIKLYQEAEQIIVDDAAALFLSHNLSHVLVQPRLKGYVLTPIHVPIERYLSLETSK